MHAGIDLDITPCSSTSSPVATSISYFAKSSTMYSPVIISSCFSSAYFCTAHTMPVTSRNTQVTTPTAMHTKPRKETDFFWVKLLGAEEIRRILSNGIAGKMGIRNRGEKGDSESRGVFGGEYGERGCEKYKKRVTLMWCW